MRKQICRERGGKEVCMDANKQETGTLAPSLTKPAESEMGDRVEPVITGEKTEKRALERLAKRKGRWVFRVE